jgi:hypothetical protein
MDDFQQNIKGKRLKRQAESLDEKKAARETVAALLWRIAKVDYSV